MSSFEPLIVNSAVVFARSTATSPRRYERIDNSAAPKIPSPTNIQNVVVQNATSIAKILKISPDSAAANPQASINIASRSLNTRPARSKRTDTISSDDDQCAGRHLPDRKRFTEKEIGQRVSE